jgi:hypothetical protein
MEKSQKLTWLVFMDTPAKINSPVIFPSLRIKPMLECPELMQRVSFVELNFRS